MVEELVDRRVVTVAETEDERQWRSTANRLAHREAWKGRRAAVAVALGAHAPLSDRGRPIPPPTRRIRIRAEHGDLARLETTVSQRRVSREAGKAAADDRALAPLVRTLAHDHVPVRCRRVAGSRSSQVPLLCYPGAAEPSLVRHRRSPQLERTDLPPLEPEREAAVLGLELSSRTTQEISVPHLVKVTRERHIGGGRALADKP
jgi:hypothetical protein